MLFSFVVLSLHYILKYPFCSKNGWASVGEEKNKNAAEVWELDKITGTCSVPTFFETENQNATLYFIKSLIDVQKITSHFWNKDTNEIDLNQRLCWQREESDTILFTLMNKSNGFRAEERK